MFHTVESATQEATNHAERQFTEKDRAGNLIARLENGNVQQQSVAAVIQTAVGDGFRCEDCGHESDPYVFILRDDEGDNHLAVACPICASSN